VSFALDVNILLYASDSGSPLHSRARKFLEACAEGSEIVYLAWPTVMAYLRIATHGAIFEKPLSPQQAMQNIGGLLALPQVRALGESDGFWDAFRQTASDIPARGNLVPDLHLATILRQHGVNTICTHDRDFRRFSFLKVVDPLAD
jgi:toxin-antitoxin system PIN domain toxin